MADDASITEMTKAISARLRAQWGGRIRNQNRTIRS